MARPPDPNIKIALLSAAEAVFVERGLDLAKVEKITERAGCSKGSFYLHFETKEQAFSTVVESWLARFMNVIDGGFQRNVRLAKEAKVDPPAILTGWLEHDVEVLEFLWQTRGVVRLLFDGGKSASFVHLIDEYAERCRPQCVQFLEWGRALGLFRKDLDTDFTSRAITGVYDRIGRELVRAPKKPDLFKLARHIQTFVFGGIGSAQLHDLLAGGEKEKR